MQLVLIIGTIAITLSDNWDKPAIRMGLKDRSGSIGDAFI